MTDYTGKKCIIRADRAGVFFGEVVSREGSEVELKNARRLWYWAGANDCTELARIGTVNPKNCKFTPPVESIAILGVIEIIPATPEAVRVIQEVKPWTQE